MDFSTIITVSLSYIVSIISSFYAGWYFSTRKKMKILVESKRLIEDSNHSTYYLYEEEISNGYENIIYFKNLGNGIIDSSDLYGKNIKVKYAETATILGYKIDDNSSEGIIDKINISNENNEILINFECLEKRDYFNVLVATNIKTKPNIVIGIKGGKVVTKYSTSKAAKRSSMIDTNNNYKDRKKDKGKNKFSFSLASAISIIPLYILSMITFIAYYFVQKKFTIDIRSLQFSDWSIFVGLIISTISLVIYLVLRFRKSRYHSRAYMKMLKKVESTLINMDKSNKDDLNI